MVETREEMILRWLPLAWRGCRRFRRCGIQLSDLRQEAVVGLILAVDGYDAGKGPFMPYASKSINHQLLEMCANQMRPYRLTNHVNNLVNKVRKTVEALNRKGVWNPSSVLISEQSGLSMPKVIRALSVDRARVPGNMLEASEDVALDYREDLATEVMTALAPCSPDQQALMTARYGLGGRPPKLLKDLAATAGITREAVRNRQLKALAAARRAARP